MKLILNVFCLFFVVVFSMHHQQLNAQLQNLKITYNVNNGLLSNDNYRIYQDLDGFIWILSEKGITKFSGHKFTYFTTEDGLNTNDVWDMAIDSQNRKWLISFANGLRYIQNDEIYTIEGSEKLGKFAFVGEHRDTTFFIQYDDERNMAARYYVTKECKFGPYKKKVNGSEILLEFILNNSNHYMLKSGYVINANHSVNTEPFKVAKISTLLGGVPNENASGNIFHISQKERKLFFSDAISIAKILIGVEEKDVVNIFHVMNNQRTVVQTSEKFYVLKNGKASGRDYQLENWLNQIEELKEIKLAHLMLDIEGNLWVVKHRGEVYFFHSSDFIVEKLNRNYNGILGNTIISSAGNCDGIFMSRPNQLFQISNEGVIKSIDLTLPIFTIRQFELINEKLLILSDYHLLVHNLRTQTTKVVATFENRLYSFCVLNDDRVILSNGSILSISNGKVKQQLAIPKDVKKFLSINSDIIYVYRDSVVVQNMVSNDQFKIAVPKLDDIELINGLLVAIAGHSLFYIDLKNRKIEKFHTSSSAIRNVNYYEGRMSIIDDNYLIFANWERGKMKLSNIQFMNLRAYGFQANNIIFRGNSKAFLFTTDGVLSLMKKQEQLPHTEIPFSIKVNQSSNTSNVIAKTNEVLSFQMEAVSFFNLGEVNFTMELWENGKLIDQQVLGKNEFQLQNLKRGNYVLKVSSSPTIFLPFGQTKTINISIQPIFYETILFKLLVALLVILSVVVSILITQKINFKRNQRALKIKELEISALRAQLNPHFIFNTLNSIQGVMLYKSKEEANELIYAFAELIRTILDSSREDKISLAQEIKLLENYLKLENMRLNNTLTYTLTFDSNIEPDSIPVYGMVIQPFVENCVVHAFKTNQEEKKIDITFDLFETYLEVTIKDNGIGIKLSEELSKNAMHKSWASTILKEKSAILNSINPKNLVIEMIDCVANGKGVGTEVIIKMKIFD